MLSLVPIGHVEQDRSDGIEDGSGCESIRVERKDVVVGEGQRDRCVPIAPCGVEPVGSPSTNGFAEVGLNSVMRLTTYFATRSATSSAQSRITRRIFVAKSFAKPPFK